MKEVRAHGIVFRPTSNGFQVGEARTRTRNGKPAEHLVRVRHYSHKQLAEACSAFTGRVAALGDVESLPEIAELLRDVQEAVAEQAAGPAPDPRKRVGALVCGLRRQQRMTQRQLARAAGCSATTVREIEKGQANPTLGMLVRVTGALGAEPDLLVRVR